MSSVQSLARCHLIISAASLEDAIERARAGLTADCDKTAGTLVSEEISRQRSKRLVDLFNWELVCRIMSS
jgi:hypothetical protein